MRVIKMLLQLICLSLFLSCTQIFQVQDYVGSVYTFEDTQARQTPQSIQNIYPEGFKKIKQTFTPGFISGSLWLAFEMLPVESGEKVVIDLGPEIVDRADLYAPDFSGKLALADSTGRTVCAAGRNVVSWRSALLVPPEQRLVFMRITSGDSVHLALRGLLLDDFYRQTNWLTFFHALVFGITGAIMLFLLTSAIFFREKLFLFLFLTNFCFLVYQFSMKGFIHTYIPFFAQNGIFTTRLSYLACMSGFVIGMLLISKCVQTGKKKDPMRWYLHAAIALIVFFALLYLFLPKLHRLYEISLVFLIFGCVATSITIFTMLIIQKRLSGGLLAVWIPFLLYVIFRQSLHIARLYYDFPRLQKLFDYDYYYSYDICFLFQLLVYTWLIYKRAQETLRGTLIENERSYFFRTMTHELLVPAVLMYQAADELKQHIPQSKKLDNLLQSIQGNAIRIQETSVLINSLEEQEQHIDRMAEKQEHVCPGESLKTIIADYKWYAEIHKKMIQSTISVTECVLVYPLFLKTVFSNLIDNAVKYGAENFPITLELFRQEDCLCFTVHSCGNPIKPDKLKSLFDFEYRDPQVKNSDSRGFGIGLYLVSRIAKLYKGKIDVRNTESCSNSAEYGGVKFSVFLKLPFVADSESLPLRVVAKVPAVEQAAAIPSHIQLLSGSPTVLFVDDDIMLLEQLHRQFSSCCTVHTAVDGLDAFEKLKTVTPDIIVCDVQMPRMDGLKLKEKCAQSDRLDAIPFLFLTASQSGLEEKRAYERGVTDYIKKPVHFDELQNRVFALLRLCEKIRREKTSSIVQLIQGGLPQPVSKVEQEKRAFDYRQSLYVKYGLSKAEKNVCELFNADNSQKNRELAEKLGCSIDTAGTHLKNAYRKLSVKDRTELAVLLNSPR